MPPFQRYTPPARGVPKRTNARGGMIPSSPILACRQRRRSKGSEDMYGKKKVAVSGCVVVLLLGGAACFGQGGAPAASAVSASIAPGTMTRIGTIDERFQSYNIEAVERKSV